MCIITLTRIFHLTYQYPTLVREITTPQLPAFMNAALNLVGTLQKVQGGSIREPKPNTPFMETVLHAILELVPRHPTIFRPFASQIRSLVTSVLSFQPPAFYPEPVIHIAEQVLVSLHKCAPKDKSGPAWTEDCRSTIVSAHRTADFILRSIKEQWESVDSTLTAPRHNYNQEVSMDGPDALGLHSWKGMHAGADRLIALLEILSGFISTPSATAVGLPLGPILDLTSRLNSVTVPASGEGSSTVQANSHIGREERELLFAELPRIHIACMYLLAHVVVVLENNTAPITQTMVEQVTWVFRNERFSRDVRMAAYHLLSSLVSVNGPAMTKQSVTSLIPAIRACCSDLLPVPGDSTVQAKAQSDPKSKSKQGQTAVNADAFLNPNIQKNGQSQSAHRFPELERSASELLQTALASIPTELLASVRTEIDRTIILTASKNAMLASVLNPVPTTKGRAAGASIIPFLVQAHADQMEVEALVRPRMPVLMTAPELDAFADEEDEEEDEDMVDEPYHVAAKTSNFLKEPVVTSTIVQKTETAAPLHKRTYVDETTTQPASLSSAPMKQVQAKKARFEETVSSVSQPAKVEATSGPKPVQITSQVTSSSVASQPSADTSLAVDESDDELPTLNMDSDTDDEDEDDEDVNMEG
jgi:pre-rRNA-processing protein RIX1